MKSLLFGLLLLSLASCNIKTPKYSIRADHNSYYTNAYTKSEDGCITFKDMCGCETEKTVTLCGTYEIIENTNPNKRY